MEMENFEREHIDIMRKRACECTLFLKKDGAFPLSENEKRIALYGNGARHTLKGGTGSGEVNSRFFVTAEEGFENAGASVTTKKWLDAYDEVYMIAKKAFMQQIIDEARRLHKEPRRHGFGAVMPEPEYSITYSEEEADACIYVLSRVCGEGNDRKAVSGDFFLTKTEKTDILILSRRYKKFMLVLNVGAPVDLSDVADVGNILILSQLGAVTGDVLSDIVYGKSYPSGKLSATWSAYKDYQNEGTFGEADETAYREGIYVGYRYFDSVGKKPLFPFGYGLSYASFEIGAAGVKLDGRTLSITAEVKNKGDHPGREVLQCYVTAPWGKLDQPMRKLIGFSKTDEIKPKEKKKAELSIDLINLSSYDAESSSWLIEKGDYIIRLTDGNADDTALCVINVLDDIIIRKVGSIGGDCGFKDFCPEHFWADEDVSSLKSLKLKKEAFSDITFKKRSEPSDRAMAFVEKLSDEQAVDLCIGYHDKSVRNFKVVGYAGHTVPGSCGDITDSIEGVPSLSMADGPAGLRIAPVYYKGKDGKVYCVYEEKPFEFNYNDKNSLPDDRSIEIHHQYCTAIPSGTALAQSWDTELLYACGDIVGREMEIFGIDIWLAPGMNIQRSVLCGRNFEYYSEDPYITGVMAEAMTRGVQSHKGKGVTLKHFCCNNQETNRFSSNSLVSERALREIYLKGFEIAVNGADPAAIMTSYNLLNGVHTAERPDLLKTLLRFEWGWSGLVMSDWSGPDKKTEKYRQTEPAHAVKGGNDIYMPGCVRDYDAVLFALTGRNKEITLSRAAVNVCAARVLDTAWKLNGM